IGRWSDPESFRGRQTKERHCDDDKSWSYCFELNDRLHDRILSLFLARVLGSMIAGLKRAKNRAGRRPRPESDPPDSFARISLACRDQKKSACFVECVVLNAQITHAETREKVR